MTPADDFDVICPYAGFHPPLPAPAPAPVPLPAAAGPMPILPHSQPPSPKGLPPPVSAPPSRRASASASVPEPEQTLENFERELENVFIERELVAILHGFWRIPQIGDYLEGGVVFYVDMQKRIALTCALEDVGLHPWGSLDVTTGVCSQELFAGRENTQRLVALGAEYKAANAASAYRGGGYIDWFLPSFNELVEMYKQRKVINQVALAHGGTAFYEQRDYTNHSYIYWSSSERTNRLAYNYFFRLPDALFTPNKDYTMNVRPVRAFRF